MSQEIEENGSTDVIAAVALIALTVVGAIHFIYTGGLPAFLELIF